MDEEIICPDIIKMKIEKGIYTEEKNVTITCDGKELDGMSCGAMNINKYLEESETINEGKIFPLETDFGFPRKLKEKKNFGEKDY